MNDSNGCDLDARGPKLVRELIHKLILDGVVDQFGIVLHVHFFKNARAVGADGFDAQRELIGDFGNGFAGRQQAQNLIFSVRQRFMGHFFKAGIQLESHLLGNGRADIFAAPEDLANRID